MGTLAHCIRRFLTRVAGIMAVVLLVAVASIIAIVLTLIGAILQIATSIVVYGFAAIVLVAACILSIVVEVFDIGRQVIGASAAGVKRLRQPRIARKEFRS